MKTIFKKETAILIHHELLLGTFFSKLIKTPNYLQTFSNVPEESCWEYIVPLTDAFSSSDASSIYISKMLPDRKNSLQFIDSWMMTEIPEKVEPPSEEFTFSVVRSKSEMQEFIDAFQQAYSGFQENDPYGRLPEIYANTLLSVFQAHKTRLEFIYLRDIYDKIIAVAAVGIDGMYSFAWCVGIVPASRNKGLAKILLQYQKYYIASKNGRFLVVQTLKDSFVEAIYRKNGFELFETMQLYQ